MSSATPHTLHTISDMARGAQVLLLSPLFVLFLFLFRGVAACDYLLGSRITPSFSTPWCRVQAQTSS
jgi:hypothetical protein